MTRATIWVVLCGVLVCLTAAVTLAQTATTTETKKFRIIAVDGNQLVVKLPEGTKELTVPQDFQFNVDGKMLSVNELKPGMTGTATITTKTTVVPVTVTEVKNGTVLQTMGTTIIVRTDDGVKMFTQSDIDKRGVKIMRGGQPAQITDFRANDKLTATIITTKPPKVMTEKISAGDPCPKRWRRWRHGQSRPRCRCGAGSVDAISRSSGAGSGDYGHCAKEAAEDRQLTASPWSDGLRVPGCSLGPDRQTASRDAVTALFDAGPRSSWTGAVRAVGDRTRHVVWPCPGRSPHSRRSDCALSRAEARSSDRFETHFGQAGSRPESPHSPGSPLIPSTPADRSVSFRRETIPPVLTPRGLLAH